MKEDFPFMPIPVDAFVRETTCLSPLETGHHINLLCAAWSRPGCSLPDDDKLLMRLARSDARTWARVKAAVMSLWVLEDSQWRHPEQSRQYEFCVTSRQKKQTGAEKTNEAKRQAKLLKEQEAADAQRIAQRLAEHDAQQDAQRTHIKTEPEPELESETKKESPLVCERREGRTQETATSKPKPDPEGFRLFWKQYPTEDGMPEDDAFREWNLLTVDERTLAVVGIKALKDYAARKGPTYPMQHASNYLRTKRWRSFKDVKPPDWEATLALARKHWFWDAKTRGPFPNTPGCRVPQHLLLATDGIGWEVYDSARGINGYPIRTAAPMAPQPDNSKGQSA